MNLCLFNKKIWLISANISWSYGTYDVWHVDTITWSHLNQVNVTEEVYLSVEQVLLVCLLRIPLRSHHRRYSQPALPPCPCLWNSTIHMKQTHIPAAQSNYFFKKKAIQYISFPQTLSMAFKRSTAVINPKMEAKINQRTDIFCPFNLLFLRISSTHNAIVCVILFWLQFLIIRRLIDLSLANLHALHSRVYLRTQDIWIL